MKRFLIRIVLFIGIPLIFLLGAYTIIDPFKTLKPFSLQYFDDTNRDYLSTELFLKNYPTEHYDSYIFGSSRACGINSYHWKKYLHEGAKQYVFQSWSETLTGIWQKIHYIDEHEIPLRNALILLDIPGSFNSCQQSEKALTIKDYKLSGQPWISYQGLLFFNFIQKPSFWAESINKKVYKRPLNITFDSISNDWIAENKYRDLSNAPERDSLTNCSDIARKSFLEEFNQKQEKTTSVPLIDKKMKRMLCDIQTIFDKHNCNYEIIVTPAPCYTNVKINPKDLKILEEIFGCSHIHNYSGKNYITDNCYNFSDPNHFNLYAGWHIIEDVYCTPTSQNSANETRL